MNRAKIMEDCPEGFEDDLKDIVDYFEGKFNEIKNNMEITQLSDLGHIEAAYGIACDAADDLY